MSAESTRSAAFVHKEKVDLFWNAEDDELILRRGGSQRPVFLGRGGSSSTVYVTSLIRLYDIPTPDRRLPVEVVNGEVFIDLRPPPVPTWQGQRMTRYVNVDGPYVGEHHNVVLRAVRIQPVLLDMFRRVARAENLKLYTWAREALLRYVEDHHPDIYHDPSFWEDEKNENDEN